MNSNNFTPDVLVIGGGPAGSTIGALLARKGWAVVLLEKDQHPRFHIGESLLPMNLPILERLGLLDKVRELGVVKLGADFTYGDNPYVYRTYLFGRALGNSVDHAFEVKRETFDHVLFENAVGAGVDAHQNHTVTGVDLDNTGNHLVKSQDASGKSYQWRPRFLVDATGRDAFLAGTKGWKIKNPKHASAAIFGHFKGVQRRPGTNQGNISLYWFDQGWIWMIPLQDDVMSVGAVCWPEYLKTRRVKSEDFLINTLRQMCPAAYSRLQNAKTVSPVRVAGNYSYRARHLSGNGYLMIGDAFAFIDPIFSSGVYLAMNSAEGGVPLVEHWLNKEKRQYNTASRRYLQRTKQGLRAYSWFIYRFTSPAMRTLFKHPTNRLQLEQAVISMLAGDVFGNKKINLRLRIFRLVYGVSWLLNVKESFVARKHRLRNVNVDFSENTETI